MYYTLKLVKLQILEQYFQCWCYSYPTSTCLTANTLTSARATSVLTHLIKYIKKAMRLSRNDAWINIEYALKAKKYAYEEEGRIETNSFLAWTYNRDGKYEEAEEILRNQLAGNKDNEWAYTELAYSLSEQGKFEEALENCFKAEDLGRNDDWLFTRIAICYKNLGKNEEALEYYLKALELSEDDIFIMSDIAWHYGALGLYAESVNYSRLTPYEC